MSSKPRNKFGQRKLVDQRSNLTSSTIDTKDRNTIGNFDKPKFIEERKDEIWNHNRDLKHKQERIKDVYRSEKRHFKTEHNEIMQEALGNKEFARRRQELENQINKTRDVDERNQLEKQLKFFESSNRQAAVITTGSVKSMNYERINWTHRKGPQTTEDLEKSRRLEEQNNRQKIMLEAQQKFDQERKLAEANLKNNDGMSKISSMNAPSFSVDPTVESTIHTFKESTYARTYTDTENSFQPEINVTGLRYAESTSCFSTIKDKIPKNIIPPFDRASETDMALYRQYKLTNDDIRLRKVPAEVQKLPIYKKRDEIIAEVENCMVTVIRGETGSGKTTQVPQFLLENAAKENRKCNIVITQPRKLATISVAKRVCKERNWDDFEASGGDSIVGYQVGLDKKIGEHTKLSFMTTGVLLRILISRKSFVDYTHLIIDEVHERDMDTDMLLLTIKYLMRKGTTCRIVLMSATMDINEYKRYFDMHFHNTETGEQPSLNEMISYETENLNLKENNDPKNPDESKTKYVKSSVGEVKCNSEPFYTNLINLTTLLNSNDLKIDNFPYQDSPRVSITYNQNRIRNKAHSLITQLGIDEKIMYPNKEENKFNSFGTDWDRPTEIKLSEAAYELAIHIIFELIPKFRKAGEKAAADQGKKLKLNKEAILIFLQNIKESSFFDIRSLKTTDFLLRSFLSGIYEIRALDQKIRQQDLKIQDEKNGGHKLDYEHRCYPLHSSITLKDQQRIFKDVSVNKVKVILATNIAESSITVPDIRYVIDFCMTKQMVADKLTTYQCLKLQYASKAQLAQRKGRAGRTKPGVVFQLLTTEFKRLVEKIKTKIKKIMCFIIFIRTCTKLV